MWLGSTWCTCSATSASTRWRWPTPERDHSIGEIVTALLAHGLRLDALIEHDWTVYPRFDWLVATDDARWRIPADRPRMPLTFTLVATRQP